MFCVRWTRSPCLPTCTAPPPVPSSVGLARMCCVAANAGVWMVRLGGNRPVQFPGPAPPMALSGTSKGPNLSLSSMGGGAARLFAPEGACCCCCCC